MNFTKREQSDSSGGLFLKLKDGVPQTGVFRGELYEFCQKWEGGKSHLANPDDPGAKTRFRANFITKEDGELKAKIFEFGFMVYNQLADIATEYDINKTALKISRRGVGMETEYTVIPAKDQPSEAALKTIGAIDLNVLEHKNAIKVKNHAPGSDDEIPF